jgi:predicted permease
MVKEEMLFFWNALPRNFKAIISFLVALLVPLLLTLLFSKTTLKDKWLIILIVLLAIFIYLSIYFYQKYRFVYKYSEYLQNQNLSVLLGIFSLFMNL